MGLSCLTIRSSRARFAAPAMRCKVSHCRGRKAGRLNSGVRPLGGSVAVRKFTLLLVLCLGSLPAIASPAQCRIVQSSMDSHSSLAGSLSSSIRQRLSQTEEVIIVGPSAKYDVDIRLVQTKLVNSADRFLPPSDSQPDFVAVYVLLDRDERFLKGRMVTCTSGVSSCASAVVAATVHVCGARPNNSFKPSPLRGLGQNPPFSGGPA